MNALIAYSMAIPTRITVVWLRMTHECSSSLIDGHSYAENRGKLWLLPGGGGRAGAQCLRRAPSREARPEPGLGDTL